MVKSSSKLDTLWYTGSPKCQRREVEEGVGGGSGGRSEEGGGGRVKVGGGVHWRGKQEILFFTLPTTISHLRPPRALDRFGSFCLHFCFHYRVWAVPCVEGTCSFGAVILNFEMVSILERGKGKEWDQYKWCTAAIQTFISAHS